MIFPLGNLKEILSYTCVCVCCVYKTWTEFLSSPPSSHTMWCRNVILRCCCCVTYSFIIARSQPVVCHIVSAGMMRAWSICICTYLSGWQAGMTTSYVSDICSMMEKHIYTIVGICGDKTDAAHLSCCVVSISSWWVCVWRVLFTYAIFSLNLLTRAHDRWSYTVHTRVQ